ncbi:hypothetical protein PG997_000388 [Apiospora hydei]|uniref:Secreted protein n=1 Tax=Apiospora hydei TaxID=1337664 RepID=A0ABR1XAS7_9PEZI
MHYITLSLLAVASLAAALPAPEPKPDQWQGVIDPWGQYGRKPENVKRAEIMYQDDDTNSTTFRIEDHEYSSDELLDLAKRATIKEFAGKIPGCGSADDPSNKDVPKPQWKVNEGVKIPKNPGWKDDACTTGHGADHCWTEYYLVEAAVEYFSWLPTGSAVNCPAAAKSSCSVQVQSLVQSCSVTGTTSSKGWDWKTIDAAGTLSIKLGGEGSRLPSGDLSLGGGYSKNYAETTHDLTNVCRADSSAVTCSWTNESGEARDLCHQVWYADRVLHVWGQAQRVCNKCAGAGAVQQNTGDGKVCVRGQKEFDFRLPINKLVHCDGACGANEPGVNQPANGPRGPYVAPNNWDLLVIGQN